jgi:ATP phosphoribosyltransferase
VTAAFSRAGADGRLKLAVPAKGRMSEPAVRLCADAGLSFELTERSLVVPCANAPVDLLLVRPSDIPEYAQDGVVDVGITGANLVAEAEAEVVTLAELGFARCSLDAAVPVDAAQQSVSDLAGLRVATAYPVSTKRLLAEVGVECSLVPVSGSVEAAPRLGLADAIVDLVSTGSTLRANELVEVERIMEISARLVVNQASLKLQRETVRAVIDAFAAATEARA